MATKYRTPKQCPTCTDGKLYFSTDAVCFDCRRDILLGRKIRKEIEEGSESFVGINTGPRFLLHEFDKPKNKPKPEQMLKWLGLLVNRSPVSGDEHEGYIFYEYRDDHTEITVKKEHMEILKNFLRGINDYIETAYHDGKKYGSDLLKRLNDGDLPYDEFIRRTK